MQRMHVVAAAEAAGFSIIDWSLLLAYMAAVIALGLRASRKRRDGGDDDFFLAGRSMPMWAVAISVLATAQSAATFVGGPQQSFAGNLTYLASNLGPLVAAFVVAFFFLPAFYRHNVTSVYELIGHEMGGGAQRLASAMFMIGRVFASGARLYVVAIALSAVAFNSLEPWPLIASIVTVTAAAALYSTTGGIRAVIWTDVLQVAVYLTGIIVALAIIWHKIPLTVSATIDVLRSSGDASKLQVIDLSLDQTKPYTLWASLIGLALFNIAAFGTDQDLTQRMLTCRTSKQASASVLIATIITFPVVLLFLMMGLLLFIYYERPDVMGDGAPHYVVEDTRRVFIAFIVNDMPAGVRGLMMAAVFAAAMSSLDSGLNSMSSTTIADFVRPWRKERSAHTRHGDAIERRLARWASLFWAAMIGGFACLCIVWHDAKQQTLIDFALNVMTYAYSGLLGVFFTAIFTQRGNARSAIAAMIIGFGTVLLLDHSVWANVLPRVNGDDSAWSMIDRISAWLQANKLAFAWRLTIAATLATMTCMIGNRSRKKEFTAEAQRTQRTQR